MNTNSEVRRWRREGKWRSDREGLFFSSLRITFQRFFLPESDIIDEAPPSLGALPVASIGHSKFLLPVAPPEAFWIGLSSRDETRFDVAIRADFGEVCALDLFGGSSCDGETAAWLSVPPRRVVAGIPTGAHFRVFGKTSEQQELKTLRFLARRCQDSKESAAACELHLVDYASYSARTGLPEPEAIDRDAGYKGYMLP